MFLALTPIEARVLGSLIEKEITTPEYYPLSLNALVNACNQKSNREPAMQLEEDEIRKALNHLESQSLVRSIAESRATKFAHRLQDVFNFYRPEVAVICELLLRGPQTPGELRTRASRMHAFEDLESVHSALQRLSKREPPLVTVLPRQPGTKESRYTHLLGDIDPLAAGHENQGPRDPTRTPHACADGLQESGEIALLRDEVAQLRGEIASLQQQFAALRKRFE
jgi:uncharacterized protein YceH (UPF0502 family)